MKLCAVAVILSSFLPAHGFAQQAENEIVINVKEPATTPPVAKYLNGYHSSINGQTIEYHSSDPDADSALLVRGQTIAPSISWETDPLPESSGDYLQFIWLAGIECAGFSEEKDTHTFDFFIDGQLWFAFKNAKDSTASDWKIAGQDGAELSFAALMTDKAGDLFGHMTLKLPTKAFAPGKPLTLEVRGDNSGSPDWYMTFQHHFNFTPQVRAEPALVKDGSRTLQVLRLSLDNLVNGRTLEVHTPDHEPISADLKIGANVLRLPIRR